MSDLFGDFGVAFFSLFQSMTGDGWSSVEREGGRERGRERESEREREDEREDEGCARDACASLRG